MKKKHRTIKVDNLTYAWTFITDEHNNLRKVITVWLDKKPWYIFTVLQSEITPKIIREFIQRKLGITPSTQYAYQSEPPDYGDLFTIEEFVSLVICGCITNYDGTGHFVNNENKVDNWTPLDCNQLSKIPSDAKYIIWFNK